MKILVAELAFELPEDFDGDLPAALDLLSEYIRSAKEEKMTHGVSQFSPTIWATFWDREPNEQLAGAFSIHDYPSKCQPTKIGTV